MEKVWEWSSYDTSEWQRLKSSFYEAVAPAATSVVGVTKAGYLEFRIPLLLSVGEQRKHGIVCCAYMQHGVDKLRIGVVERNLPATETGKLLVLVNSIDQSVNQLVAL